MRAIGWCCLVQRHTTRRTGETEGDRGRGRVGRSFGLSDVAALVHGLALASFLKPAIACSWPLHRSSAELPHEDERSRNAHSSLIIARVSACSPCHSPSST